MFEEYSKAALATVLHATQHAQHRRRAEIGCSELLTAALDHDVVSAGIRRLGVEPTSVTDGGGMVRPRFRPRARRSGPMSYTPGATVALRRAAQLRRDLDRPAVTIGILVLALSEDESTAGTTALRERLREPSGSSVLADLADPPDVGSSASAHQIRHTS